MELSRPLCVDCKKNLAKTTGAPKKDGSRYYQSRCMGCINAKNHGRRRGVRKPWQRSAATQYKKYKKSYCEAPGCGFVALHPHQLDVDHIDGDHRNHDPANLQTLCANCHRLKTALNKEFTSKKWRESI